MPPTLNYSHVPYYSMINPLLHCAASNTVDSQCLPISISMSVNIPYHCRYNETECIPRLYISIVLIRSQNDDYLYQASKRIYVI